ncbi:hypothetical protein CLU79DRAFT_677728, partial [Phycomyces nitens]
FWEKEKWGQCRILGENHRQVILNYIDENPFAVLTKVIKRLNAQIYRSYVSHIMIYNL